MNPTDNNRRPTDRTDNPPSKQERIEQAGGIGHNRQDNKLKPVYNKHKLIETRTIYTKQILTIRHKEIHSRQEHIEIIRIFKIKAEGTSPRSDGNIDTNTQQQSAVTDKAVEQKIAHNNKTKNKKTNQVYRTRDNPPTGGKATGKKTRLGRRRHSYRITAIKGVFVLLVITNPYHKMVEVGRKCKAHHNHTIKHHNIKRDTIGSQTTQKRKQISHSNRNKE